MRFLFFIFFLSTLFIFSCTKAELVTIDESNLLIGTWSNPVYQDSVTIYSRVSTQEKDRYELTLKKNFLVVENGNSGWCATPPITYTRYAGEWAIMGNDTIFIKTEFWGGIKESTYEILSLTEDNLSVKFIEGRTIMFQ